ncbi:MAG: hypothetical protein JXR70_07180 [Spirochaetales bacterium]|nr:hypothetical protein [Spirochaetales bacterium]
MIILKDLGVTCFRSAQAGRALRGSGFACESLKREIIALQAFVKGFLKKPLYASPIPNAVKYPMALLYCKKIDKSV